MISLIFSVLFSLLLAQHVSCQRGNDFCEAENNIRTQCVPLRSCSSARRAVEEGLYIQNCGYTRRGRPMVCCRMSTRGRNPLPERTVATSLAPQNLNSAEGCGLSRTLRTFTPLVMGGVNATEGRWPWMVAITYRDRNGLEDMSCTGAMIDMRHVLTAAHCVDSGDSSRFSTRIGHLEWRKGVQFDIERIISHEGYQRGFYYDDIAILRLNQEVNDPRVTTICLPSPQIAGMDLVGMGTTVAGWGATSFGRPMSEQLQQLSGIPVISNSQCNSVFEERLRSFRSQFPRGISEGFLCAGFLEGNRDSCSGDSGGPLMFRNEGRWSVVGIVSFGYQCGQPGYPGGYTRVSQYLEWIRRNTGA